MKPKEPKTKLGALATIQMGVAFRMRLEPEKGGNTLVIQMRDLTEDNRLNTRNLLAIRLNHAKEGHFVRRKDLIFRSRGKMTATTIIDTELERVIIAAPLLRVRIKDERVLPEYLCWFINQPPSRAFLHSRATGTAVMTVGKSVLENLEVLLPDIETQKRIAKITALSNEEQRLMRDLAAQKKRLADGVSMRLAKESVANFSQWG